MSTAVLTMESVGVVRRSPYVTTTAWIAAGCAVFLYVLPSPPPSPSHGPSEPYRGADNGHYRPQTAPPEPTRPTFTPPAPPPQVSNPGPIFHGSDGTVIENYHPNPGPVVDRGAVLHEPNYSDPSYRAPTDAGVVGVKTPKHLAAPEPLDAGAAAEVRPPSKRHGGLAAEPLDAGAAAEARPAGKSHGGLAPGEPLDMKN